MDKEHGVVQEIPLMNMPSEKTDKNVQVKIEPLSRTRTDELARPKRQPKPLLFDRIYRACNEQAIAVKATIIAAITCIPFVVFYCVANFVCPKHTKIGPPNYRVDIRFLASWLLICWGSFIGLLYIGRIVSSGVCWLCTQSQSLARYKRLAAETTVRSTLMLWAAVGYVTVGDLARDRSLSDIKQSQLASWVAHLQKAFMFLIIAFAIIFVQGILLQLITIQYIEGYIGPRSERASNELETIKSLQDLVNPHLASDHIGFFAKMLRKLFLPTNTRDPYYLTSRGQGNDEIWSDYASGLWQRISGGKQYITVQDITQRLVSMNRDPEHGRDLFYALDDSTDGQVTEDEVHKLVRKVGLQLNRRAQAMTGIKNLIHKLEIITSIIMLGIIFFVYVQFFEQNYAKNLGTLWSGIVALSFAFSGPVLEFTNACVFVFGKHPYDVGDYIETKGKKFVVNRVYLTHTNFEQVKSEHVRGLVTQISHASLVGEPIINWTRTLEEAVERHAAGESADGAKTGARADDVAELVKLKVASLKGNTTGTAF